jgi:predicted Co/Zn/Cd cation transporter (cation efflux family)
MMARAVYADPVMVSLMALLALPIPVAVRRRSLREVLMMNEAGDELSRRRAAVLEELKAENDIVSCRPCGDGSMRAEFAGPT